MKMRCILNKCRRINILIMILFINLMSCSEAYTVPDKSIFEPFTANELRKCYAKVPGFDEFYSEYCLLVIRCGEQEKIKFADITWRGLYKCWDAMMWKYLSINHNDNYLNKTKQYWKKCYGKYDDKVDSVMTSWNKIVCDYFGQYVDINLVNVKRKYYPLGNRIKEIHYAFNITPTMEPITECHFMFDRDSYRINQIVNSSVTLDWKTNSDIFLGYEYLSTKSVLVTYVRLINGNMYSISDLQIPELVKKYILADNHTDEREAWKSVFEDIFGIDYDLGTSYEGYIKESKFMEEAEVSWIRHRYSREMDFVEALNKLE